MARYDRIAPLTAPVRESSFPGWLVLRDIEGNDRDVEAARRARLRFLALRPVTRLLERGVDGVGRESYLSQIEAVREELGYLPARDIERARLARFLHSIEGREAARVITATLECGRCVRQRGTDAWCRRIRFDGSRAGGSERVRAFARRRTHDTCSNLP
jgi:hypothetical protein